MDDPRRTPGLRPFLLLGGAMIFIGLALAANDATRFLNGWRGRGLVAFNEGIIQPHLEGLIAMLEGILGGSLVGKWLAALWLVKRADPREHAWVRRTLFFALVVIGGFEFGLLWILGIPPADAITEIGIPVVLGFVLWRMHKAADKSDTSDASTPPASTERPLAWRGLEAFAWANVALGLALSFVVFAPPFALYREAMAQLWFDQSTLPSFVDPWLRYGFGTVGVAFAGHFAVLAGVARHAHAKPWALRLYTGTVLAWFVVDSTACALQGAWFNVLMVNVPALAGTIALGLWAKLSARG